MNAFFRPDTSFIRSLAASLYGLDVAVAPLPGEIDLNFRVESAAGQVFTLKMAHEGESEGHLDLQNCLIERLAGAGTDLTSPGVVPDMSGRLISLITLPDGSSRFVRLLRWINGQCLAEVKPHSDTLLERVGELCGKLCRAFDGFDHPAAHRFIKWDPSQVRWTKEFVGLFSNEEHTLATYFLDLFEKQAFPLLPVLRKGVNYNDANDYNILVVPDGNDYSVPGVIDFGDAVYTHKVNELAIAAAYVLMHKPDPLGALESLVKGFHREFPLTEAEMEALLPLTGARLLISVTCSAQNRADHPENEYLQISDAPAWELMHRLSKIPPSLFTATVRAACGLEPFPAASGFATWAKSWKGGASIVPASLKDAVWLDLSVGSPALGSWSDISDAGKLHRAIHRQWADCDDPAPLAIGRYDEARPFYTADAYEVTGNNGPEWRTVHIGLDIFMDPGTPVSAPLDGVIHSFRDNDQDRDYGPTIILQHETPETGVFYTLYGHLTRTSLDGLRAGAPVRAGEVFCAIGPMPENGNWSPHLHFQVILDMLGMEGDFPGVAFPEKRHIWTSLCPDPWLLLTGLASEKPEYRREADMIDYRRRHLGKNLSLSYRKPLHIVRGWKQYLFDINGRRYLDTVNNVAHVGHEHPDLVAAGQRQMAVLNTNTRYLNERILEFTEEMLKTLPPQLEVIFLVNSGSEANELALRLSRARTSQRDMIAVEVGYHGNTQACVDISSYKFDGPGGSGAPAHTHVAPLPDAFRGIYRGNTRETGLQYARHIQEIAEGLKAVGRGPAAFICESVISCGGQIPLPPGYLQAAAGAVRACGGLLSWGRGRYAKRSFPGGL
ncbi:MAG: aminotransferase class III-fold pyridoxal phosphate-dependent enzyme [Bacteroidota bacterium]